MAIAKSTPRIVELATQISKSVADLQAVLDAKGVPSPSFDENAPPKLPKEANDAQDAVLDATAELHDLLLEPVTLVLKNSAVRLPAQRDCWHRIAKRDLPSRTTAWEVLGSCAALTSRTWCPSEGNFRTRRSRRKPALPSSSSRASCAIVCACASSAKRSPG